MGKRKRASDVEGAGPFEVAEGVGSVSEVELAADERRAPAHRRLHHVVDELDEVLRLRDAVPEPDQVEPEHRWERQAGCEHGASSIDRHGRACEAQTESVADTPLFSPIIFWTSSLGRER